MKNCSLLPLIYVVFQMITELRPPKASWCVNYIDNNLITYSHGRSFL